MERCILSPQNDSANEINEKMIEEMPGEEQYTIVLTEWLDKKETMKTMQIILKISQLSL